MNDRYEKHLESTEVVMVEAKGIFNIFSTFFKDIGKFIKFTVKAKSATNNYQKKAKGLFDKDGMILVSDANKLMDEYVVELEDLVKSSGVSKHIADAFLASVQQSAQQSKKSWS